jgi:hypothetical protein
MPTASRSSRSARPNSLSGATCPSRPTCWISEILDAGLLGEGVMRTFRHAVLQLTVGHTDSHFFFRLPAV